MFNKLHVDSKAKEIRYVFDIRAKFQQQQKEANTNQKSNGFIVSVTVSKTVSIAVVNSIYILVCFRFSIEKKIMKLSFLAMRNKQKCSG